MKKLLMGAMLMLLFVSKASLAGAWLCTAFYINGDGYLATASHCVKNAAKMEIMGIDKKVKKAKLVAVDYDNDVAIIKVDGKSPDYYNIGLYPNADSRIYILGYPLPEIRGFNLKSKDGYILNDYGTAYRAAGGTCEGNSGGPVVNSSNQVIGVLVAGYGSSPCAYYVEIEKIQNVIALAVKLHIDMEIIVPSLQDAGNLTLQGSLDKDTAKTPIFLGST